MTGPSVNLIEKLAKEIGELILKNFPKVESAEVTVHKPKAPIPIPFKDVSVTIKSER
ncbi:MAG: dihydroneopterin aldolase [Candidatus Nanopelagicaceae bacterium]